MRAPLVLLADAVAVLVFAAIGRASHAEGDAVLGVLRTAWPFLAGLLLAHALGVALRGRRRGWRPEGWAVGAVATVGTVVVGMLLRVATGAGTATSFVVVATISLAVFFEGWRALVRVTTRPTTRRGTADRPLQRASR